MLRKKEWTRFAGIGLLLLFLWFGAQLFGYQDRVSAAETRMEETEVSRIDVPEPEAIEEKEQRLASRYENLEGQETRLEERLSQARTGEGDLTEIGQMEEELELIRSRKQKIMQECFDK